MARCKARKSQQLKRQFEHPGFSVEDTLKELCPVGSTITYVLRNRTAQNVVVNFLVADKQGVIHAIDHLIAYFLDLSIDDNHGDGVVYPSASAGDISYMLNRKLHGEGPGFRLIRLSQWY